MNDADADHRQQVALFRYGLIADLVRVAPGSKGLYAKIVEKAAGEYTIPGTTRTRVAAETLRDWLKRYRRGGFDALLPKPRADRGQWRSLPVEVVDVLLEIKEGNPALSVQLVIREARQHPEVPAAFPLPASTVHRLLARHGLMDKAGDNRGDADRRCFAFRQAGELWMSDVMHGPSVFIKGRTKRKTYLIAFIDDATRVIPYCAFACAENTATFLPVLKQAILRRGLVQRLYVDNGAHYRSQHLALVCAKLGIALIPVKKTPRPAMCYMETEEIIAILRQPDHSSLEGQRDHALLALLYNAGARIQEALDVCPRVIRFESPAQVELLGKGRKSRICALWPETVAVLKALLRRQQRADDEPLFVNRYGHPLGAAGVRFKLKQYVRVAAQHVPSLATKRVTPHTWRHSVGVQLVAAGVDVTVIRNWLGHARLDTTNHYARANLDTKRKALEQVDPSTKPGRPPRWKRNPELLSWLDSQ